MIDEKLLGPEGQPPDEAPPPDGEAEVRLAVGSGISDSGPTVLIEFGTPVSWLGLCPDGAESLGKMILGHAHRMRATRLFHRDALDIPEGEEERHHFIKWVLNHPLWSHPETILLPPPGNDYSPEDFEEPGPDWVNTVVEEGSYHDCLSFEYVFVNPFTERIEDDPSLNTAFRIWVEAGGWYDRSEDPNLFVPPGGWDDDNRWGNTHDPDLDCGAADMESALIELGLRLKFFYNDDGTQKTVPENCGGEFENDDDVDGKFIDHCVDAGDGFCKVCGYAIEPPEDEE